MDFISILFFNLSFLWYSVDVHHHRRLGKVGVVGKDKDHAGPIRVVPLTSRCTEHGWMFSILLLLLLLPRSLESYIIIMILDPSMP